MDNLFILASIQPTGPCCLGAILFLANCRILDPEHLLHDHLVRPLDAWQETLKPRYMFVPTAQKLDNTSELDIHVGQWTDFSWNMEYLNNPSKLYDFISRVSSRLLEHSLPSLA